VSQSIDFVGIEAFINSEHSLRLWSLYISPASNPSTALFNTLFQFIGHNSILEDDVNGYHPIWDINNSLNHRSDIFFSSLINFYVASTLVLLRASIVHHSPTPQWILLSPPTLSTGTYLGLLKKSLTAVITFP
jgi:hypothetical protein